MEPAVNDSSDLTTFIDFLYSGLEGYAYLAAKDPEGDAENWVQEFFEMPAQRELLETTIEKVSKSHEIYLAPALFDKKRALREDVKVSNVVWTEFDGNAPAEWEDDKKPSVIVQSSLESHHHVYWRLTEALQGADSIEELTKRITYNYQADQSAWDANQVLRPPGTYNHKRSAQVQTLSVLALKYDGDLFRSLPEPPKQAEPSQWKVAEVPDVEDVLLRYAFTEDLVQLIKRDVIPEGKRSTALTNLAYGCCQIGLSDVEVFVVIKAAATKWGKFEGRKDKDKRLAQLIAFARKKYPAEEFSQNTESNLAFAFDYKTFLSIEFEFDWILEGMLMDQGNMLMAGPSGVGKTQISLEFMKHIALGKDIFHYKVPSAQKIVFLSLEMGHPDLKVFLEAQDKTLTDEERDLLAENLIIIPHGEAWPLNKPVGQEQLRGVIEKYEPKGIFVDSVGSAILGNINANDVVQSFINFNDSIRNQYGLFTWYIHHTRKAQPGQRVSGQDDVYGDQYLVNRSTSSYGVLPSKSGRIKIRNFKNRLARQEEDYYLERDPDTLTFTPVTQAIDDMEENLPQILKGEDNEPRPKAGDFDL